MGIQISARLTISEVNSQSTILVSSLLLNNQAYRCLHGVSNSPDHSILMTREEAAQYIEALAMEHRGGWARLAKLRAAKELRCGPADAMVRWQVVEGWEPEPA